MTVRGCRYVGIRDGEGEGVMLWVLMVRVRV